jgi:hypothetical protein
LSLDSYSFNSILKYLVLHNPIALQIRMTTVANDGMARFMGEMASALDSKACKVVVRETETCLLNNLDISSCTNFELGCCNELNSKILTCTNTQVLVDKIGKVIGEVYDNYPEAHGYMYKQSQSSSNSRVSIVSKMQSTVSAQCSAQALTSQTADLPSITAHQCSDVFINLANNTSVDIRCAMGFLNNILPDIPIQPANGPAVNPVVTFFHLHWEGLYILIGLGSLFVILLVLTISMKFVAIAKPKPAK